jgi:hypothetical protein
VPGIYVAGHFHSRSSHQGGDRRAPKDRAAHGAAVEIADRAAGISLKAEAIIMLSRLAASALLLLILSFVV